MDLFTAIEKSWPYLVVGAPGAYVVIKDLLGRREAERKAALNAEAAEADLMLKVQEAARQMVTMQADEVARLAVRLAHVEAELRDLQREHTRMISDKDAKITALEGEKRQLLAQIETYKRVLAAHKISDLTLGHFQITGDPPSLTPAAEEAL